MYKLKLNNDFLKHVERNSRIPIKFLQEMDTTHVSLVVRNKDKIRLIEAENLEGMVYVLIDRKMIQDYNNFGNKSLRDKFRDFIRGKIAINHDDMDLFCYRIHRDKKLLKKYFPSVYGFA